MIDAIFGWAFLKVELFSNLLWKNNRKLNDFDKTHLKIWTGLCQKDEGCELLEALEEFLAIPGLKYSPEILTVMLSMSKEQERRDYQYDQGPSSETASGIIKIFKERLNKLMKAVSHGKSQICHEFSQLHDKDPLIVQKNNAIRMLLQNFIDIRNIIEYIENNLSETELLQELKLVYQTMVDDIVDIYMLKTEECVTDRPRYNCKAENSVDVIDEKEMQLTEKSANYETLQGTPDVEEHGNIIGPICHDQAVGKEDIYPLSTGLDSNRNIQEDSMENPHIEKHQLKSPDVTTGGVTDEIEEYLKEHDTSPSSDELDQLEMFRTLQCFVKKSPVGMENTIGNVFLLASQKVSKILEEHMNKYRLRNIHLGSSGTGGQHPLEIFNLTTIQNSGIRTKSIRVPILLKGNSHQLFTLIHRIQAKKLQYLWALDLHHVQTYSRTAGSEHQSPTQSEIDEADLMVPLIDIAPYVELEDNKYDSPSTWLPSADKRFYNSLLGSDRRRTTLCNQESAASPPSTRNHLCHSVNAHADAICSTTESIGTAKVHTILNSLKLHLPFGQDPCCVATDMAGGDVSAGEPEKGIRRKLWETEGHDGDHGVAMHLGDQSHRLSPNSTSIWENDQLQRGFTSAFDIVGSPKNRKSLGYDRSTDKNPSPQVKLSESVKALRKLQKEFASRDVTKDLENNATHIDRKAEFLQVNDKQCYNNTKDRSTELTINAKRQSCGNNVHVNLNWNLNNREEEGYVNIPVHEYSQPTVSSKSTKNEAHGNQSYKNLSLNNQEENGYGNITVQEYYRPNESTDFTRSDSRGNQLCENMNWNFNNQEGGYRNHPSEEYWARNESTYPNMGNACGNQFHENMNWNFNNQEGGYQNHPSEEYWARNELTYPNMGDACGNEFHENMNWNLNNRDEETYGDIPEQEYYCIGNNDDIWDDVQPTDFEFHTNREPMYQDQYQYDETSFHNAQDVIFPDMYKSNEACVAGYENFSGYQQWSNFDNCEEKAIGAYEPESVIQNNFVTVTSSFQRGYCAVNSENMTSLQIQPMDQHMPTGQHYNLSSDARMKRNCNRGATAHDATQPPMESRCDQPHMQSAAQPSNNMPPQMHTSILPPVMQSNNMLMQSSNTAITYNQNVTINQQVQPQMQCNLPCGSHIPQLHGYPFPNFSLPRTFVLPPPIYSQQQYALPWMQNQIGNGVTEMMLQRRFPNASNFNVYDRIQPPFLSQAFPAPHTTHGSQVHGMVQQNQPTFNPFRQ